MTRTLQSTGTGTSERDGEKAPPLILIVDDNLPNLQVLGQMLESEGFDIALANSGEQACKMVRSALPDLVLLDIMMPGLNGYEVCDILRDNPDTREIPVIFLTAKTQPDDILSGFRHGGVDYIVKPFQSAELLARVRTHVELKRSRQKLKELIAAKDRFFFILSHDLKSVISGIITLVEATLSDLNHNSTQNLSEYLTTVVRSGRHLYRLLHNLLDWATVQSGAMPFRPATIAVSELATVVVDLFQGHTASKQLTLVNEICPDHAVLADYDMTLTVLRNLVSNAIKFSQPGRRITLSSNRNGNSVHVSVCDNGVGIRPDDLPKLFQVDTNFSTPGTAKEKGTGLGLVLCRELLLKNGGDIRVESTPGEGATFTFHLPRSDGEK